MNGSVWDGSTGLLDLFFEEIRIWTGKFEIPIVAPDMARSVIAVKMGNMTGSIGMVELVFRLVF